MFHPWGCPGVGQQGPHLLCPPGKSPPAPSQWRDVQSQPFPCTNGKVVAHRGCSHTRIAQWGQRCDPRLSPSDLPGLGGKHIFQAAVSQWCAFIPRAQGNQTSQQDDRFVPMSSGPALPPWCPQMRMWKVLGAKRKGVCQQAESSLPSSSSPTLPPGVPKAGKEPKCVGGGRWTPSINPRPWSSWPLQGLRAHPFESEITSCLCPRLWASVYFPVKWG